MLIKFSEGRRYPILMETSGFHKNCPSLVDVLRKITSNTPQDSSLINCEQKQLWLLIVTVFLEHILSTETKRSISN